MSASGAVSSSVEAARCADEDCGPSCRTECINASLNGDEFTFQEINIFTQKNLTVCFKEGDQQKQTINIFKLVTVPTPQIWNVTYFSDEAVINFKFEHFYVKQPKFQVEIWGDTGARIQAEIENGKKINIGEDKLRDSEVYRVHVRAKPINYFDGPWTEWSPVKSFTVNNTRKVTVAESPPSELYLIIPVSILVALISFVVLCWRREIRAYLFPVIPHPKATLAQIHREKESLPVSFSPEIFKDIKISPVDYAEEKHLTSETGEDHDERCCQDDLEPSRPGSRCEMQDGDEPVPEVETSHLKIKLLDDHTSATDGGNNMSVAAVPGYAKDETYVTMSSLYKTQ
ncbi:interleukin-7 receptor subunit alpha [Trichomycterus rosablanca]|uniref:interleukin-7 receptor subunit alpha n=1 Tax=Trichomycterus rosablanca TaxID=2290929 RepID=UPI002F350831